MKNSRRKYEVFMKIQKLSLNSFNLQNFITPCLLYYKNPNLAITIASIDCVCHCEVASTVAISSEKARLLRFTRNDNSYCWIENYKFLNTVLSSLKEVFMKRERVLFILTILMILVFSS